MHVLCSTMLTDAVLLSRPASRNEENTLLSASSSKSTDKFSGCGAKSGHLRFAMKGKLHGGGAPGFDPSQNDESLSTVYRRVSSTGL